MPPSADASFEAANACVQNHGGFGFAAPISTNLILSYLTEHVLGMPKSY